MRWRGFLGDFKWGVFVGISVGIFSLGGCERWRFVLWWHSCTLNSFGGEICKVIIWR